MSSSTSQEGQQLERLRVRICETIRKRNAKALQYQTLQRGAEKYYEAKRRLARSRMVSGAQEMRTWVKERDEGRLLIANQHAEMRRIYEWIVGEWETEFALHFDQYTRIMCRRNTMAMETSMQRLPQEIRDMIYVYLPTFNWDDTRCKILVRENEAGIPIWRTPGERVIALREGHWNFWDIQDGQLHYYEDENYVGPLIAKDMAELYYRNGYFDLKTNTHLLERFFQEDRFRYHLEPARLLRRVALCFNLRRDNNGVEQCIKHLLAPATKCTIELSIIIDTGKQGLNQLLTLSLILIPVARQLLAKNLRLHLHIFDQDRGPWRLGGKSSRLSLPGTLMEIAKKVLASCHQGEELDTRVLDEFSEWNRVPVRESLPS